MLHPSTMDDAPLSCNIIETNLHKPAEYCALSYTWGDESPNQPMFIQEDAASPTASCSTILLGPNCAAALLKLRKFMQNHESATLGIWVDAVCIDQAATGEKNAQVDIMFDIYNHAKTVIVWLGDKWAPKNDRSISFWAHERFNWIQRKRWMSEFKLKIQRWACRLGLKSIVFARIMVGEFATDIDQFVSTREGFYSYETRLTGVERGPFKKLHTRMSKSSATTLK